MGRCCAFPNCTNKQKTWSAISFYKLPFSDPVRLKLWLRALRIESTVTKRTLRRRELRVCSVHFCPEDLIQHEYRSCLTSTAVPISAISGDRTPRGIDTGAVSPDRVSAQSADNPSPAEAHSDSEEFFAADLPKPPPLKRGGRRRCHQRSKWSISSHTSPEYSPASRDAKSFSSHTKQEPGGAQSEDDGCPIEDDADFDELDYLPQPPPLKEGGMEHGGSEQTAISRQASSAGTDQISDLAMESESAQSEHGFSPVEEDTDVEEPEVTRPTQRPLLKERSRLLRKRLSRYLLSIPSSAAARKRTRASSLVSGPTAAPYLPETMGNGGEPCDGASADTRLIFVHDTSDLLDSVSVPPTGLPPSNRASSCCAAAGGYTKRRWVVIESQLVELYQNCGHCKDVASAVADK